MLKGCFLFCLGFFFFLGETVFQFIEFQEFRVTQNSQRSGRVSFHWLWCCSRVSCVRVKGRIKGIIRQINEELLLDWSTLGKGVALFSLRYNFSSLWRKQNCVRNVITVCFTVFLDYWTWRNLKITKNECEGYVILMLASLQNLAS